MIRSHRIEVSVAITIVALAICLAIVAPPYFSVENLTDLFLANMPVLIIAIGMTLVILIRQIDISVGSIFAICGVAAGALAKSGAPFWAADLAAVALGMALGSINGAFVAFLRMPSIVVTLGTMVTMRQSLLWYTQGAWVQDLPAGFQWFGLSRVTYSAVSLSATLIALITVGWGLRNLAIGRALYAVGSNEEGARLSGFRTGWICFGMFAMTGALTGLAAVLNSVRFNQIPSNTGLGLELKVIAAVVVGGTSISGGRGTLTGTILGVILLGAIGPALIFLHVNAFWEKAIQGLIILLSVCLDVVRAGSLENRSSFVKSRVG